MKKIAIVGAGIGGMAAAWDLTNAGHAVTIYEAAEYVGGLAAGFKSDRWEWSVERFYHHWFASDKDMLGLIAELGLSEKVIFKRPYTVVYWEGKFYPFDSIFTNIPLFLLRHFSIIDVLRYGLAGAYLRFSPWWKPLEQTTADAWTRKFFGKRIYETQWRPLLVSKFGETFVSQVNMAWLWARLHSRTTQLGTFEGGFQAFSDTFAEILRRKGVQFQMNTPVQAIVPIPEGLQMHTAAGAASFDQVLVTTSPALMAKMAPALPQNYLKGLLDLKSMGAVVMVLALRKQFSPEGYYWYNIPKNAGFPFLSVVEHTNFLSPEYFGGDHILYIGDYLEPGHEYFTLTKEQLLERFTAALPRINPEFTPEWVKESWLWRTNYAQPIPLINHSANIPAINTPIPGLYFASMSQVYPWDRGTNYAVEIARRAVRQMLA